MNALRVILLVVSAALLYMTEAFTSFAAGALGYWRLVVPVAVMAGAMAIASVLVLLLAFACGRRADALRAIGLVLVCSSGLVLTICLMVLLAMVDPEMHRLLAAVKHPTIATWRLLVASAVPVLALSQGVMLLRFDARRHDASASVPTSLLS